MPKISPFIFFYSKNLVKLAYGVFATLATSQIWKKEKEKENQSHYLI
jgi:hypothetical protein